MLSVILGATLAAGSAQGQPRQTPAQRLNEISAKLEQAIKASTDGTAAFKALQDLQTRMAELQKEMARHKAMADSFDAIRKKVVDYDTRLGNMELALAAVKMQLAGKVATAGFKNAFFIQSSNKKFLLRIGGLLQGGYVGRVVSEKTDSSGAKIASNESTFILRRARLGLSGHLLNWRLAYRLEMDLAPVDPGPVLEGWAELQIHRMLKIRGGRQKVHFGRQFLIHSAYQQFIERSEVTDTFSPGWDLGLSIRGDLPLVGLLSYQLGIFNGATPLDEIDDNTDFIYAVRMVYEPLGPISLAEGDVEVSKFKIALGGAFTYNLKPTDRALRKGTIDPAQAKIDNDGDNDGQVDNVGIYGINAELTFRLGGVAWQNEFFYRIEEPGAVGDQRSFLGLYSQASFYHFNSTLEIAARYGFWQPHYYGTDRSSARPEDIHEVAVVLNALTWNRRIKWQLEYSHQWRQNLQVSGKALDMDLKVNQIRLQMQMAF